MNIFQWVTIPILSLLLLVDLRNTLFRTPTFRRDRIVRCIVWAVAIAAVVDPDMTTNISSLVGIKRGADLVLYLAVFGFLGSSFYFYSRSVKLERELTEIVRHLAIEEARFKEPV